MGSQSKDIKCDKTVALTNTSKCDRFIFDVTLEISYVADAKWNSDSLLRKIIRLVKPSSTEWKGTISVTGQYHDTNSVSGYSEIIYDWFCYDGYMTVPKISTNTTRFVPNVYLQYTMRFLLSPALPAAQSIYCAKGYEKITYLSSTDWEISEDILDTEEDQIKEYNHLKVWQVASQMI
ncbi:hypothetical protein PV326_007722 [Microctonus aethiopoides]|nr:hypothetical protein PV326_007722 [Microctonus aethiopoides]